MSADDWFRNSEWSNEIASAFEAKLKRARRKAQYLRIQAGYLAKLHPEVTLTLLERYFELDDDFDQAQGYVDRATAFLTLGRTVEAIAAYEAALRREAEFPKLQTKAFLDLPFLIATTPIPERFDQALLILRESNGLLLFPVDLFKWNAVQALILSARGLDSEARTFATDAIKAAAREESGLRYHQDVGLVTGRFVDIIQKLRQIEHAA